MKPALFLTFLIGFTFSVKSQIWCSPGSVWHYDTSNPAFSTTYTKQTYLYDTLVGTVMFNKIRSHRVGEGVSGPINNTIFFYTSIQNNVVLYNSSNYALPMATDTLFYFGPVGAKWRANPSGTSCSHSFMEITEVGSSVIQGETLNWHRVAYKNYYYYGTIQQVEVNGIDTLFERMGCMGMAFQFGGHCADYTDAYPARFRCFQDNDINLNVTNKTCDYTTGIHEFTKDENLFTLHPNPTTGMVTVTLNKTMDSDATLELCTVLGQVVYSEKTSQESIVLNIRELKNGIYVLRITGDKTFSVKKIIKE